MSQNSAQILLQSLEKKNKVLDAVIEENSLQEEILKQEELDMNAFDESIDRMGALAEELDKLDTGFEAVYERIREDILQNKSLYQKEIAQMQQLIAQITDKVVKINVVRMRNKDRAESQFRKANREIQSAISKTKAVKTYYSSMNKLNYVAPQFYDNKK